MKHLQSFENQRIDRILDKISSFGIENLSDLEKDYLKNIDNKELQRKLNSRDMKISRLWDYDPRNDKEFWGEQNFDFSKYDDDMIENGRYEIAYEEISENDIEQFEKVFNVTDMKHKTGGYKSWEKLSKETQEKFKKYLSDLY